VAGFQDTVIASVGSRPVAAAVQPNPDVTTTASAMEQDGDGKAAPPRGNLAGEAPLALHQPAPPRQSASSTGLNAAATEFIPTLSQHCPLVGFCMLVGQGECTPEENMEPLMSGALEASFNEFGRSLEDAPEGADAAAPAARRRRRKAKKTPEHPTQEWKVMPEASEEVWQHREEMRRKELAALEERLFRVAPAAATATASKADAMAADKAGGAEGEKICDGCQEKGLPEQPNPIDRTISRRSWRKAADQWFKDALARWCLEEGHGSVASTEEWQSLATISTNCDGVSDCSD